MMRRVIIIVLLLSFFSLTTGCSKCVSGKYYSQSNSINYLELERGNKFESYQAGIKYSGEYKINGTELILQLVNGKTAKAEIEGCTITDKDGDKWVLSGSQPPEDPIQKKKRSCLNYVKKNAVDPSTYVIDKLKENDIVILGEMHEIKDNLDFISENMSKFYHEGGVRIFATEFVRSHNNKLINEIVTAKKFDYNGVVAIYRDFSWVWGYKGYIDIIKSIWELNNSLPEGQEKLKIVGLDFGWRDWSGAKVESTEDRDKYMSDVFINTYGKGNSGKAIIHTGFNHSFLDFHRDENCMGNYLHKVYGNRIFQICLHQKFETGNSGRTTNGFYLPDFIDVIYRSNGGKALGFDVKESPFEDMRDDVTDYFKDGDNVTFGDIAEGYIVFEASVDMKRTSFVDNFVDMSNFEKVKEIVKTRRWFEFPDSISMDDFNKKLTGFFNSF